MPDRIEPFVVYRDAHFLVLHKPSGLATTSPGQGPTLVQAAHRLDPEAARLHPSSRLDAEVSGLVTFARTKEATEHLLAARQAGEYTRGYLALAPRAPSPADGEWREAIAIDRRDPRKRIVAGQGAAGARDAHTLYRTLDALPQAALLWLSPQTGRTHQLRVHAAHAGIPLLGDRHYGGAARVVRVDGSVISVRRTMLHCTRVSFPNPEGGTRLLFEALPPPDFVALWVALDGPSLVLPPT